jgi:hypothetical protein
MNFSSPFRMNMSSVPWIERHPGIPGFQIALGQLLKKATRLPMLCERFADALRLQPRHRANGSLIKDFSLGSRAADLPER